MSSTRNIHDRRLADAWATLQAHSNAGLPLEPDAARLAFADPEFLLRRETRGIRFQLELLKPDLGQQAHGIENTIVVFGSARIIENGPGRHAGWYAAARELGKIVSERGGALIDNGLPRDNVIATGGGPGIMEAANRGACDAGAPSVGFNITLPFEQEPNAYSTPELTFRFHYFAMRKMHLAMRANALAVFPGGFGTFDELFELLTLVQTSKATPRPIVLFGRRYWENAVNFPFLVEEGMIDAKDLSLFEIVDTPEEAWASLVRRGLQAAPPPIIPAAPLAPRARRRKPEEERMKKPGP